MSTPRGRIASVGRDRRVRSGVPMAVSSETWAPPPTRATRVAWTADGRNSGLGDYSGEIRLWNLDNSTSSSTSDAGDARPAALALVNPDLSPARRYPPQPRTIAPLTLANRTEAPGDPVNDVEDALASARATAAAAERTVLKLSRLAESRDRPKKGAVSAGNTTTSAGNALESARAALSLLQVALNADPGEAHRSVPWRRPGEQSGSSSRSTDTATQLLLLLRPLDVERPLRGVFHRSSWTDRSLVFEGRPNAILSCTVNRNKPELPSRNLSSSR